MVGGRLMDPATCLIICAAVGSSALTAGFLTGQWFRTQKEAALARRLGDANRCIRELQAAVRSGVGRASLLSMIRRYWECQASDASPETYADPAGDVPAVPVHAVGDRNV